MSEPHILRDQGHQELADRVVGLATQIADLRAAVEELGRQLSTQVRTRSIVVVDDDGFERVVIAARDAYGAVSVYGRSAPGRPTCAELFANDPMDGDGAQVGMSVTDSGEVVAVLEVLNGKPPQLHLESRPEPP